uniref:Uncharacterized protein n=1 Tax=Mola mola TaxID=94237 RepID=A0A3Q3X614_MOLML
MFLFQVLNVTNYCLEFNLQDEKNFFRSLNVSVSSELEFVQIIIIIVVMTVMVVVIICLLSHYKLSTWSFITRQSQARRHDHAPQQDGCLWPSESGSRQGASEVLYAPQARDRFTAPSFMQRDRFSRFQPTYPYLQHQIDLPPTMAGAPPPYQGPCTLQLRDPEQQMELNRESVRAPPNRTIYDMAGGAGEQDDPAAEPIRKHNSTCQGQGRLNTVPPPPPTKQQSLYHSVSLSTLPGTNEYQAELQQNEGREEARLQFLPGGGTSAAAALRTERTASTD